MKWTRAACLSAFVQDRARQSTDPYAAPMGALIRPTVNWLARPASVKSSPSVSCTKEHAIHRQPVATTAVPLVATASKTRQDIQAATVLFAVVNGNPSVAQMASPTPIRAGYVTKRADITRASLSSIKECAVSPQRLLYLLRSDFQNLSTNNEAKSILKSKQEFEQM